MKKKEFSDERHNKEIQKRDRKATILNTKMQYNFDKRRTSLLIRIALPKIARDCFVYSSIPKLLTRVILKTKDYSYPRPLAIREQQWELQLSREKVKTFRRTKERYKGVPSVPIARAKRAKCANCTCKLVNYRIAP